MIKYQVKEKANKNEQEVVVEEKEEGVVGQEGNHDGQKMENAQVNQVNMKNIEEKQRSANQIPDGQMKEKADKNDEQLEKDVVLEEEVVEEEVGQRTDTVYEEGKQQIT